MSWGTVARNWLLGSSVIVVAAALVSPAGAAPSPAMTPDPGIGSQGTDTALAATDSLATAHGRGRFEGLKVTVNQTRELANQAISVTWEGAAPTREGPGRFAGNYMQLMQCWGDPVTAADGSIGPPPEQCVFGAVGGTYDGVSGALFPSPQAVNRVMTQTDWPNYVAGDGVVDERTNYVWRPFRAVKGDVVGAHFDPTFNPAIDGGDYWLNDYFDVNTTNEVAGAATGADGRGSVLFQVLTGRESSGLGCGRSVSTPAGKVEPRCWLVMVPRGTAVDENVGTPFEAFATQYGVVTSPLSNAAWQNRIAIELEFNSIESPCVLGSDERRMAGTEMAQAAVGRWQPALCTGAGLPPFSFVTIADVAARQQLAAGAVGSPGAILTARALEPGQLHAEHPVVYAPVAVSAATIGFNIERVVHPSAPPAEVVLSGTRVAEINLTPRLVAKLLTQSYRGAAAIGGYAPSSYTWLHARTPRGLVDDPDFLQFNPEFAMLYAGSPRGVAALAVPTATSDVARQLWEWILADPEAAEWLAGKPDPWEMHVNPYYSTDPARQPGGGTFGTPSPISFPRADPYCFQAAPIGVYRVTPTPLCAGDWLPYTRGFLDAAVIARTASFGARIVENGYARLVSEAWSRETPQPIGQRSAMVLTDSASAARFGLQTARLSRAGDNRANRSFVAPTEASMASGLSAMVADPAGLLVPAFERQVAGAYPLTLVSYAASKPTTLSAAARDDYAAFVEYAAGEGQHLGFAPGDLPAGYLPLTPALAGDARAAANLIRTLESPPPPTTVAPATTVAPEASTTTLDGAATSTTAPQPNPSTTVAAAPAPVNAAPAPLPAAAPAPSNAAKPATASAATTATTTTTTTSSSLPTSSSVATTSTSVAATTVPDATIAPPSAAPPLTPAAPLNVVRLAVPGVASAALACVLGALEISKRPRRPRAGRP